ncbi:Tll0287-like domain-containing protein [Motiliproteus sediminis]|uniref:Tll0287-like domain-containing protein n=1 Tax=Motiliproteus sediminis TaxID=1468178 RepID=UPI001AEFADFE|nr:DUF3365 domain-containing protein [Motiliproteus sediminis]
MKPILPLLFGALASSLSWASPAPLLQSEARQAVQALAGRLQTEMKSAMQEGGPVQAIHACNTRALPLTEQISQEQGLEISRTALRVRNPENQPDAWEAQVLQRFLERQQAGEPLKGMTHSEIVEEEGRKVFRMLQAIPTQTQCLGCHGDQLDPKVADKIDGLYPEDKARGFKAGELRGAFSIRRVM